MALPTLQIVLRPGILDLGWGHPDPVLLPVEGMRHACAAALDRYGPDALQYGHTRGAGPLLEWLIARIGRREGRTPAPQEIILTAGNSFALDYFLTLCTTPGDTVLVESPTYHLALRILRDHHLDLIPVPADSEGLQIEKVAAALAQLKRAGRRARALYTVPTFNNPQGVSLSEDRRRALVELAEREDLLIVEDDVYRELAYDGPSPASLWSMAPSGVVVRIGSFSKSLAPGLRLGWLTAGRDLVDRFAAGGALDSGGGVNPFTALAVAELCAAGEFDAQVDRLCEAYRARRDALVGALHTALPDGCEVNTPGGGFFVWVMLPDQLSSETLLPVAEAAGVSYIPGTSFYASGGSHNALRLAFSLYPPGELIEAGQRLGRAIKMLIERGLA